MDLYDSLIDEVRNQKSRKANGPIEHWLTTLATGFWGFDKEHAGIWHDLKPGSVMVFQATEPNLDYVQKNRKFPKISGFIGFGLVSHVSEKDNCRWLSEVIDSKTKASGEYKVWPYLIHFSHTFWFGNILGIDAQAVQASIEGCSGDKLDLHAEIEMLSKNMLSRDQMNAVDFGFGAQGTGGILRTKANILADLILGKKSSSSVRYFGLNEQLHELKESAISSDQPWISLGEKRPLKRNRKSISKKAPAEVKSVKIDYTVAAVRNGIVGSVGEQIALDLERDFLLKNFGEEAVSRLVHVSEVLGDSAGYDIRSVRMIDGKLTDHFIEVKTTSGNENEPFYLSAGELDFAKSNVDAYEILRIHSLDQTERTYKYFRLSGESVLGLEMAPVSYRVAVIDSSEDESSD